MYVYDAFDRTLVTERAAEFRDQLDFGRKALRHRALIVGGLKTRSKLAARGARRWS